MMGHLAMSRKAKYSGKEVKAFGKGVKKTNQSRPPSAYQGKRGAKLS